MTIALNKDARKDAIASIERYFQENMDERIGNVAAGALLGFFLEERSVPRSTTRRSRMSRSGCRPG